MTKRPPRPTRRTVVGAAAGLFPLAAGPAAGGAGPVVNDVTGLNPVTVARIVRPRGTDEIFRLIRASTGPLSIGGGCYSMGGQIAEPGSLHLDMRGCNRLLGLDVARRIVRVETGMTWRALQERIDPHDLAVKIMQSYANFTIGGALSVNAHGRYVGAGPVINAVRAIRIVLADGSVVDASPQGNADLFHAAIGGYGGVGVITEAELDLVPNDRIEQVAQRVTLADYPRHFRDDVLGAGDAVLHNANIDPDDFGHLMSITWRRTSRPLTVTQRLFPPGAADPKEAAAIWALEKLPGAHSLRRALVDPVFYSGRPVVWRNHEASQDVASLGVIAGADATHALQEYFIPQPRFAAFAAAMAAILAAGPVVALNVSVRHSPAGPAMPLAWAREPVFSFVLYHRQHRSMAAQAEVGRWTRQLIDAALSLGGTYYLPYQRHATRAQFLRAYPQAPVFFALKAKFDPHNRFRNGLWDAYGPV